MAEVAPIGVGGKEQTKAPPALRRQDFWLCVAFFISLGLNSLMAWNLTLNLTPYFSRLFFEGADWGNTLLAMFQTGCLSTQVFLLTRRGPPSRRWFFIAAGALNLVIFTVLTPIVAYLPVKSASALLHISCLILGVASGILQGAGYAYAGLLPQNFTTQLSMGQGLSSIVAFAWNTFFAFVCFDLESRDGLEKMTWASYMLCAGLACVYLALFAALQARPWARSAFVSQARLADVAKTRGVDEHSTGVVTCPAGERQSSYSVGALEEASEQGKTAHTEVASAQATAPEPTAAWAELERRPAKVFLRHALPHMFSVYLLFFITLNQFPRMGPVGWHFNQKVPNHFLLLFGVFSIGDFLGRFVPNLSRVRGFRWLSIPPKFLLGLTIVRALWYVPFVLAYKLKDTTVINDFWWLVVVMFFFALTHSWMTTLGFLYSSTSVRESERSVTGPLTVVFLSCGVLSGLYLALAY